MKNVSYILVLSVFTTVSKTLIETHVFRNLKKIILL